mmetsp:Transcript_9224/g.19022  ORF Transcript_9224/g.19022 Transcript_9224/m.19022 type:complete len:255 (-) Transcript_9224:41-805(-)
MVTVLVRHKARPTIRNRLTDLFLAVREAAAFSFRTSSFQEERAHGGLHFVAAFAFRIWPALVGAVPCIHDGIGTSLLVVHGTQDGTSDGLRVALAFALPHALAHALVHALVHALGHHGHHALLHPSHHRSFASSFVHALLHWKTTTTSTAPALALSAIKAPFSTVHRAVVRYMREITAVSFGALANLPKRARDVLRSCSSHFALLFLRAHHAAIAIVSQCFQTSVLAVHRAKTHRPHGATHRVHRRHGRDRRGH